MYFVVQAFCNALMIEVVSEDDDFFSIGGDSISAAHAAHNIGIDMRLLYTCPFMLIFIHNLLGRS